jgi:uncharacterized protein
MRAHIDFLVRVRFLLAGSGNRRSSSHAGTARAASLNDFEGHGGERLETRPQSAEIRGRGDLAARVGNVIPILFGSADRPLFGVYSAAVGPSRGRGVVICPPFGQEYIRSHRTCRMLATRLADQGNDVLRFDYFGTGDSGGEPDELSLAGAIDDAVAAIEEIRDVASVRAVTVIGLRAGALVAARAALASRLVDRLVLWDAVSDGARYVAEEIDTGDSLGPDGDREARGFVFTRALLGELRGASLLSTESYPPEVLLVSCEESAERQLLEAHVRGRSRAVESSVMESPPCWLEVADLGVGVVPAEALTRIAAW